MISFDYRLNVHVRKINQLSLLLLLLTQTPHSVDPVHTLQKGIKNTGPLPRIEDRIDIVTTDIPVVGEISSLTKVPMVESLE